MTMLVSNKQDLAIMFEKLLMATMVDWSSVVSRFAWLMVELEFLGIDQGPNQVLEVLL